MAELSPHSAFLTAGLLSGSKNPYLARYRAGIAAQDSSLTAAAAATHIPQPQRLWTEVGTHGRASWLPPPGLEDSISACDELLAELQSDMLSVPTATFSSKFSTRATLGVMFHGNIIESMVVGGPAFNCQKLDRGDELLCVDGTDVDDSNRNRLLIGKDVPGSSVTLTVQKASGERRDVVVSRMKSEAIADKRRIFELFTTILDMVGSYDESQATIVEEMINLWTRMMLADAEHDKKIENNVKACVKRASEKCRQLKDGLVQHLQHLQNANDKPADAIFTPRTKAQAARDLSNLLSDPTTRGAEEFERDLDDQLSAMLRLQNDLSIARPEEHKAKEMLEDFERQQASQPLSHARQALNLSRAKAQLAKAQEELREKSMELSRLKAELDSPFRGTGSDKRDGGLLSKFGNLGQMFREKEDALANMKDENRVLNEQVQHLTISSDAMVADLNAKETELARIREAVVEARRNASAESREAILQKTVGGLVRKSRSQAKAIAMNTWMADCCNVKRIRILESKVVGRWKHSRLAGSYLLWKDHVAAFKRQRQTLTRVTSRWCNKMLWLGWRAFEIAASERSLGLEKAARNSELEKAACDIMDVKELLSREVALRRQRARLVRTYDAWRTYNLRKKRDWSVCHILLPHHRQMVMYEMAFDWRRGIGGDVDAVMHLRADKELKEGLRADISLALAKKCGSAQAALSQICIRRVDTGRKAALIEYWASSRGTDPQELADEIQAQMLNASSRLKLRGTMTNKATQHTLVLTKRQQMHRYNFKLLRHVLFEWQYLIVMEVHESQMTSARDRIIEAQDLYDQASQSVQDIKHRLQERCKKALQRMLHLHLASAFDSFVTRVRQVKKNRAVVTRVLQRMRHAQISHAFDHYLALVIEKKENRRMVHRVLQRILYAQQRKAFEFWLVYAEHVRREQENAAHELAKRDLVSEVTDLKKLSEDRLKSSNDIVQKEIDRRVNICQCTVRRMLAAHLAQAFDTFATRVAETKQKRETCKKVFKRIMHRQLAFAFDTFDSITMEFRERRLFVAKAISRWKNAGLQKCFEAWLEYVADCKLEKKWAAWDGMRKKMSGEFEVQKGDFEARVQQEKTRRMEICQRTVKRILSSHLSMAWNSYVGAVHQGKRNRSVVHRTLQRMRHAQLAEGFDRYAVNVLECKSKRASVSRSISKMLHARLSQTFDAWHANFLETKHISREIFIKEAQEQLQQELVIQRERHKEAVDNEAKRRLELCKRIIKRIQNEHLAKSFHSFVSTVAERIYRRTTIQRVLQRMQHMALAVAFDRYSQLVERTIECRRVAAKMMSRMRHAKLFAAFEMWLDSIMLERDAIKEEGLEQAQKKIAAQLTQEGHAKVEKEKERRMSVCRRMLTRMLNEHLAKSFHSFVSTVAERIYRRTTIQRVLQRMQHMALAVAFDRYSQLVERTIECRRVAAKMMSRMRHAKLFAAFEMWLDSIMLERDAIKEEGLEQAQKKIAAQFAQLATDQEEVDAKVEKEKERRMSVCRRMLTKMMKAHLSEAFEGYWHRVVELKRQRKLLARVLQRMRHVALSAAFDGLASAVKILIAQREFLAKAVARWRLQTLALGFDVFLQFIEARRIEIKEEGYERARQAIETKLNETMESTRSALENESLEHEEILKREKERRIEICRRTVKRMLQSDLTMAFQTYRHQITQFKSHRLLCRKIVHRMMHGHLAAAYNGFMNSVHRRRRQRIGVSRVIWRLKNRTLAKAFENFRRVLLEEQRQREDNDRLQKQVEVLTDLLAGTSIGKVLQEKTVQEYALCETTREKRALMVTIVDQETKIAELERKLTNLEQLSTKRGHIYEAGAHQDTEQFQHEILRRCRKLLAHALGLAPDLDYEPFYSDPLLSALRFPMNETPRKVSPETSPSAPINGNSNAQSKGSVKPSGIVASKGTDASRADVRRELLEAERVKQQEEEMATRQHEFALGKGIARCREVEATRRAHQAATTAHKDSEFCVGCGNDLAGGLTKYGSDVSVCSFCGIRQETRMPHVKPKAQLARNLGPSVSKPLPVEPASPRSVDPDSEIARYAEASSNVLAHSASNPDAEYWDRSDQYAEGHDGHTTTWLTVARRPGAILGMSL